MLPRSRLRATGRTQDGEDDVQLVADDLVAVAPKVATAGRGALDDHQSQLIDGLLAFGSSHRLGGLRTGNGVWGGVCLLVDPADVFP